VGRRKLGHDPFRHGRFTIIVEQRENSLYKTQNKGCFIKYTLFSANQYKIQWYSYLVALVIEVTRIKKAYKINDLGLDIIGRDIWSVGYVGIALIVDGGKNYGKQIFRKYKK
jgi:ribosomal protein L27